MKESTQFPGILISEDGKTILSRRGKPLTQFLQSGKPHVVVNIGKPILKPVQLLVALAYHPDKYESGLRVLNISGDYQNTHHSNLKWATWAEVYEKEKQSGARTKKQGRNVEIYHPKSDVKEIPGFPGFLINEDGTEIVSPSRNKLSASIQNQYLHVTLCLDLKVKRTSVHRLVALTYLGPATPEKPWVNHKDGNKLTNHYSNLEWTSISQNIQHAVDTGLKQFPTGEGHYNFGLKVAPETAKKMSEAKIGTKHPKYKGYYTYLGQTFYSCRSLVQSYPQLESKIRRNKLPGLEFHPAN